MSRLWTAGGVFVGGLYEGRDSYRYGKEADQMPTSEENVYFLETSLELPPIVPPCVAEQKRLFACREKETRPICVIHEKYKKNRKKETFVILCASWRYLRANKKRRKTSTAADVPDVSYAGFFLKRAGSSASTSEAALLNKSNGSVLHNVVFRIIYTVRVITFVYAPKWRRWHHDSFFF